MKKKAILITSIVILIAIIILTIFLVITKFNKNIVDDVVSETNTVASGTVETSEMGNATKVNSEEAMSKIVGVWNTKYVVDNNNAEKNSNLAEIFGSSYLQFGSKMVFNEDGTFSDGVRPITNGNVSTRGTYTIYENYMKMGDCYIELTYDDGKKVMVQKVLDSDNNEVLPVNVDEYACQAYLVKENTNATKVNSEESTTKIVGVWNTKYVVDYNNAEKNSNLTDIFGSSYLQFGSKMVFNEDGTFSDGVRPITNGNVSTKGTYIVYENYMKMGDCYIELTYDDGKKVMVQKVLDSDNNEVLPINIEEYGCQAYLVKE